MPTAIQGFTPTQVGGRAPSKGFNDMNGDDFMKVMIAQMQNQDPLEPSKSDQLLTQMSQIKQLESSTQLAENLKSLSLQQSIGSGGNLIGKAVAGIDECGDNVTGIVKGVGVQDKTVYLLLDSGKQLPLSNVTEIAQVNQNANGSAAANSAQAQALLQSPQIQSVLAAMGLAGTNLTDQQLASVLSSQQGQQLLSQYAQAQSGSDSSTSGGGLLSGALGLLGL
jgi:flagellar basal-body rod modification protein FlgD